MKNDALQGNNSCIFLKTQILYIVFINLQMFPIAVKAAPTLEHGRLIIKKKCRKHEREFERTRKFVNTNFFVLPNALKCLHQAMKTRRAFYIFFYKICVQHELSHIWCSSLSLHRKVRPVLLPLNIQTIVIWPGTGRLVVQLSR